MNLALQVSTWGAWIVQLGTEINKAVFESLDRMITSFFGRLPFLLAGLIVLLLFWILSKIIRRIFLAGSKRTSIDVRLRILFGRLIAGSIIVLGVFVAMTVVIPSFDLGSVIAGLGFTSFVIGFATKDILNNFLSGILILWHQPFKIGDYIFVGTNQGKVEYIGVRATSLRKDDGELVLIPNGDMYSSALTIRGAGSKRRLTLRFNLGFHENIDRAKEIVRIALTETDGVVAEPSPNVFVTDLTDSGVSITANFWLDTTKNRPMGVFDRAAIAVKSELEVAGFDLFPTSPPAVKAAPEEVVENRKHGSEFD